MSATPQPDTTRAVIAGVMAERMMQRERWGDADLSPLEWLGILAEEFGEFAQLVNYVFVPPVETNTNLQRMHLLTMRQELTQVAAVAVAAIESLERNELRGIVDGGSE